VQKQLKSIADKKFNSLKEGRIGDKFEGDKLSGFNFGKRQTEGGRLGGPMSLQISHDLQNRRTQNNSFRPPLLHTLGTSFNRGQRFKSAFRNDDSDSWQKSKNELAQDIDIQKGKLLLKHLLK